MNNKNQPPHQNPSQGSQTSQGSQGSPAQSSELNLSKLIDSTLANCPVYRSLEVVGERWSLMIVRDLLFDSPKRFQDFSESLRGISPSTLSKRLKTLEAAGILKRSVVNTHPPRSEYILTEKGEELRPIVRSLRDWGMKHG
jgi:DNA-binding HxlR family transcriptional regulator